MAKAKTAKSATIKPTRTKAGPPELCACTRPMQLERRNGKLTGEVKCPGRVVCSRPAKRYERAYKIAKPDYKIELEPPAGSYTTKSEPCQTGRKGCPVQLFFRDNKPFVRFCGKAREITKTDRKTGETKTVRVGAKQPGWIVPVESPTKARRLVAAACKQWSKTGDFDEKNVAVLFAKKARAGSGPDQALGRVRAR